MQVIIQFFSLLISGVSAVFGFMLNIGSIIEYSIQMLPSQLSDTLLVCFGLILAVRVLELLP